MKFFPYLQILLLALLLTGCEAEAPKLANNAPAPPFSLSTLDGTRIRFPEDLKGQIVVLRFWADWCPFCVTEMGDIEPVYQAWRDRGLRLLAVNVRQDRETVARFIDNLHISYPVLLDETGSLAQSYGVTALPTTFFIDREGRLATRILGEASPELFERIVNGL